MHEASPPADDFLAEVCGEWEAEAAAAREHGIRTAIVRVGLVLGKSGGAYPLMSRPFRLFAGGPIGLGRAWMSWIHVYNATAPNPVSNGEFTRTLASVLHRPALFPVPPQALRLLLGEFAKVVTGSCRASPLRTLALGYEFEHPKLREALEDLEK